jgi:peptide/nickel transport system substrate-binding protein
MAPAATTAPEATVASAGTGTKTLVMAVEGSVPTFDPLGADDSRTDTPSINLYNALLQVKPGTTDVQPDLAESYEVSKDGLTYTFKLRQGVKFHSGNDFTSADAKYTVDRMLALKKGVYHTLGQVTSADAPDASTLVLHVQQSFPVLPQALVRLYILDSKTVKQNEANGDWGEKWLQDHEAGSGPYTLTSFEPEQQFTMTKFPGYYKGWGGSHADVVIFRVIKEEATRRLALEQGEADWIIVWSADSYQSIKKDTGMSLYEDLTLNQLYIALNNTNQYLKDPKVRQALSLVYDYQGHVQKVRNGYADIARGPLPPSIPCFDQSIQPSQTDVAKAKQLMADAGYPNGGFDLTMAYQGTMNEEGSTFQLMAAGAAQLGITIKPMPVEWPAKVQAFSSQETAPAMGTIWAYPNYPDPDAYLPLQVESNNIGNGGFNFAYYKNPKMDQLLDSARGELDANKRCDLYKQAQQLWIQDVPYMNIVVGHALAASRDYVKGYTWSPSHAFAPDTYLMSVDAKPAK